MKAIKLSAEPTERTRSHNASGTWKNPKVTLEEVRQPTPGPRDLLLKTAYCGLCGSDFHLSEANSNGSILYPGLLELPVTLGHEFSAIVAGYGDSITSEEKKKFPIGSAVTAEEMLWCGECATCRNGNVNHCENLEELGFTRNGAQAEFLVVGIKYCWDLSPLEKTLGRDSALQAGALVEPYAVAYRALFQGAQKSPWQPQDRLLIFGAGPIGLACLDLALAFGGKNIQVVEHIENRKNLAIKLGATAAHTSGSQTNDLFDWIIDAAGATEAVISTAEKNLAVGGSVCLLARSEGRSSFNPEFLITKNARIFGSQGHSGDETFAKVLKLIAEKKVNPLRIVDRVIGFEEAAARLSQHDRRPGKILLKPHKELL